MSRWLPLVLLFGCGVALAWSGFAPRDRQTWWLEVAPALLAAPVLILTARRFRLSNLAYTLISIHALVLMVGGHWTYADVPLFNWLRDSLGLTRNPYDRVGHFAQGFSPAIIARELLLRTSPLGKGKWLNFLVLACCLAVSASYELIEWAAAMALGQGADQFLGTQGDPWDTQWDMFMALVGATVALLTMAGLHDRSLAAALKRSAASPRSPAKIDPAMV